MDTEVSFQRKEHPSARLLPLIILAAVLQGTSGVPRVAGAVASPGSTQDLSPSTHYVWKKSHTPTPPYITWATAAHTIQEAVDAAAAGHTVIVTNGLYATGGRLIDGAVSNRVTVDLGIVVRSVNGPEVTAIEGGSATRCVSIGGDAVLEGFTLTNGHSRSAGGAWCDASAMLTNCVVTSNSATYLNGHGGGLRGGRLHNCLIKGNWTQNGNGGGTYESTLQNCVLAGNWAIGSGGGVWGGSLSNCVLAGNDSRNGNGGGAANADLFSCLLQTNSALYYGGGAYQGGLSNCTLIGNNSRHANGGGGGAADASVNSCIVRSNVAAGYGGGLFRGAAFGCEIQENSAIYGGGSWGGTLYNSLMTGNSARYWGGGARSATLLNCTVANNSSTERAGGGLDSCTGTNCIVYSNQAPSEDNWRESILYYTCTTPLPGDGAGNITSAPLFVSAVVGNYRLRYGSPGIDAGRNLSSIIGDDLDGNSRPLDGNGNGIATFDMGAYEYNPQTGDSSNDGIPDWWCLRYSLDPNDARIANSDLDRDRQTTYAEWMADTDPTNAKSCFRISGVSGTARARVYFTGSSNRFYTLLRCTAIRDTPSFWTAVPGQAGIRGSGGVDVLTDTSSLPARFYRVQVELAP